MIVIIIITVFIQVVWDFLWSDLRLEHLLLGQLFGISVLEILSWSKIWKFSVLYKHFSIKVFFDYSFLFLIKDYGHIIFYSIYMTINCGETHPMMDSKNYLSLSWCCNDECKNALFIIIRKCNNDERWNYVINCNDLFIFYTWSSYYVHTII